MVKDKLQSEFSDDAILNTGIMANIGIWREIVHYNTLIFYKISKHPANNCDLDNFVSVHIMFMYKSYENMCNKKKRKFCQEMAKLRTTVSRRIES